MPRKRGPFRGGAEVRAPFLSHRTFLTAESEECAKELCSNPPARVRLVAMNNQWQPDLCDDPFTVEDLAALGVGRERLRTWLRHGDVKRLSHGVFVRAGLEEHFSGVTQALLTGRTIASPLLAARLRNLWLPANPHSTTEASRRLTRANGVVVEEVGRLLLPNLEWTALLIARYQSLPEATIPLDSALRNGAEREQLVRIADGVQSWPGGSELRRAVSLADSLSESPLETKARVQFVLAGLPAPELQKWFSVMGGRFRVDFAWPSAGVIAEADGMLKYKESADMFAEKRRHSQLTELGYQVHRFGMADVASPNSGFIQGLRRALRA